MTDIETHVRRVVTIRVENQIVKNEMQIEVVPGEENLFAKSFSLKKTLLEILSAAISICGGGLGHVLGWRLIVVCLPFVCLFIWDYVIHISWPSHVGRNFACFSRHN